MCLSVCVCGGGEGVCVCGRAGGGGDEEPETDPRETHSGGGGSRTSTRNTVVKDLSHRLGHRDLVVLQQVFTDLHDLEVSVVMAKAVEDHVPPVQLQQRGFHCVSEHRQTGGKEECMKDGWMQQHQSYTEHRHADRQRDRQVKGGMYEGWADAATSPKLH